MYMILSGVLASFCKCMPVAWFGGDACDLTGIDKNPLKEYLSIVCMKMRFNNRNDVLEYEKRLTKGGYPGILFDVVLAELTGCKEIIDVGAGNGFFSIPLARQGFIVKAVEPSAEMIKVFQDKIDKQITSLINIYHSNWESWEGKKSDALICIHAIYTMNIDKAIQKMKLHSNKSLLIIRSDEETTALSWLIRKEMNIERRLLKHTRMRVTSIFNEHHIKFITKDIEISKVLFFENIEDALGYYCFSLGVGSFSQKTVRKIIEAHLKWKNGKLYTLEKYWEKLFIF